MDMPFDKVYPVVYALFLPVLSQLNPAVVAPKTSHILPRFLQSITFDKPQVKRRFFVIVGK
jgi:hypothetical protein